MEIMVAPGKNKNVDILEFEDAVRGTLNPRGALIRILAAEA